MQKADVILTILNEKSEQNKDYVFQRVYRHLFNLDMYLRAYGKIYAKEGNMTPGVDGETIDGFNIEMVERLIEDIRYERYHPKPVRRQYIPKKDGSQRPLGIPSFRDKLVQEVMRSILEAIYEPLFLDCSHGFRPNRSCRRRSPSTKLIGKFVLHFFEPACEPEPASGLYISGSGSQTGSGSSAKFS